MKREWVLLASVSSVCIGVWVMLLFSFFGDNQNPTEFLASEKESVSDFYKDEEESLSDTSTDTNRGEEEADSVAEEVDTEQEAELPLFETNINLDSTMIRERGIYPGDFTDIAPDGIISIDLVLERILQEEKR